MEIQDECLGRHAAVLQVVADQLRTLELTHEGGSLDQCTFAIEAVASALIVAGLSRVETL
jgi:hypothetical protein